MPPAFSGAPVAYVSNGYNPESDRWWEGCAEGKGAYGDLVSEVS